MLRSTSFDVLLEDHGISGVEDEVGLELRNGVGASGADCATACALDNPHRTAIDRLPRGTRADGSTHRVTSAEPLLFASPLPSPDSTREKTLSNDSAPQGFRLRFQFRQAGRCWTGFHRPETVRRPLARIETNLFSPSDTVSATFSRRDTPRARTPRLCRVSHFHAWSNTALNVRPGSATDIKSAENAFEIGLRATSPLLVMRHPSGAPQADPWSRQT